MKKIFITSSLLFILIISCTTRSKENNEDLELVILNDTLVAFSYDLQKDTINVLNYSIKNNSGQIYYFKQGSGDNLLLKKVYKNGIYVSIYEVNGKEVTYSDKLPFEHKNKSICDSCCDFKQSMRLVKDIERLKESIEGGYYYTKDKRHYFFIHPKEKIYFKQYINLTDSLRYEDTRFNYAHLKKDIDYSSKFFIPSDSTDFKEELPKDILKTIEHNNAKVYHGRLESKNEVVIKVID
ncbi:hypothetical protein [uncultured Flavobacterium sp.]|uniref:hypothetical protein n=1 Tax=uncultured Flavobacterium sp. TaxID=165435 RepID=UPI0025E072F0|nr:hypothetical protein [uncultured Flavobacterium sp.]